MFNRKLNAFLVVLSASHLHIFTDGVPTESNASDRILTITAKWTLYDLYVDGVLRNLANGNNYTVPDAVPLSSTNRLIGVTATDLTTTCAGVLASVTDDYLVSDAKWKCEIGAPPGWYNLGFDDSLWDDAHVIGQNNNVTSPEACTVLTGISSISPDAYWIWTSSIEDAPYYDQIIYCRAYLPTCERDSPCQNGGTCNRNDVNICSCPPGYNGTYCELTQSRTLVITSHGSLSEVYVDEVQHPLPNGDQMNATDSVPVPKESRLIAVHAVSTSDVCAGFIGSVTNDSLVTDSSWKCSEFGAENWFKLGFDDFSWPNAFVVGRNGDVSVPACPEMNEVISDISLAAYWIWTQPVSTTPVARSGDDRLIDRAVFCRGYLPFCATYPPCENGGTCLENSPNMCACPEGWAGRYCEKVWTPCANEPCLNNGTCAITSDNTFHCSCILGYTGVICETKIKNRNLTITVKSTLYDLYVDGRRQNNLTFANNWTIPDVVSISPISRLLGVMAIDSTETCAGILGSVTDDYLVTDDINWKCSYMPDLNWYTLGWDDTTWSLAHPVEYNQSANYPLGCDILPDNIPPISPSAQWIWTDTIETAPEYHQTIYCRGYLPLCDRESPCYNGGTCNKNNDTICTCLVGFVGDYCQAVDLKNVSITAKETLYAAYVDGKKLALKYGNDSTKVDNFRVNTTSRLVALMAIQLDGHCPGILASVTDDRGDYVLTDTTWRCSPTATTRWEELGYDDTLWPAAKIMHQNDLTNETQCPNNFTEIAEISPNAFWIWTNNPTGGQDVVAFCRGYLPICNVSPCKNGGTCNYIDPDRLCICNTNYSGRYCENRDNATVLSDNTQTAASGQKLSDTDGARPIPLPLFVVPPAATTASSAPAEKANESDLRNSRKVLRKDQQAVTG